MQTVVGTNEQKHASEALKKILPPKIVNDGGKQRHPIRILSWNVNGLRACAAKFGGLASILEQLNADVICFQEHKLRKNDLDSEVAVVPGWESFFAATRGNTGYSGVVTYCRSAVTVPIAAEEGLTGILGLQPAHRHQALLNPVFAGSGFTVEQLMAIDQEGRVVITDHGHFVLFNWYNVAITDEKAEDRRQLKRWINKAVQLRVQSYLAAGRRVVVVGDLNICPRPEDYRYPEEMQDWKTASPELSSSAWLYHLSYDGPPESNGFFVDTFRLFHPNRLHAYTHWSTASGARVHNWGSRIDLILVAGPGLLAGQPARVAVEDWVVEGDIIPEMQGSDHAPCTATLAFDTPLPADISAPPAAISSRRLFSVKQSTLKQWFATGQRKLEPKLTRHGSLCDVPNVCVTNSQSTGVPGQVDYSLRHSMSQAMIPVHSQQQVLDNPRDKPQEAEMYPCPSDQLIPSPSQTFGTFQNNSQLHPVKNNVKDGIDAAATHGLPATQTTHSYQQPDYDSSQLAQQPYCEHTQPQAMKDEFPLPAPKQAGIGVMHRSAAPSKTAKSAKLKKAGAGNSQPKLTAFLKPLPATSIRDTQPSKGQPVTSSHAVNKQGMQQSSAFPQAQRHDRDKLTPIRQNLVGSSRQPQSQTAAPSSSIEGKQDPMRLGNHQHLEADVTVDHVPAFQQPLDTGFQTQQPASGNDGMSVGFPYHDVSNQVSHTPLQSPTLCATAMQTLSVPSQCNASPSGNTPSSGAYADDRQGNNKQMLIQEASNTGSQPETQQTIAAGNQDPISSSQAREQGTASGGLKLDRNEAAVKWKQIQNMMKPPNCYQHKEPAVIREVKKAGPNKGRLFYVCCRPDGPPPVGRCDFFKWADNRSSSDVGGSGGAKNIFNNKNEVYSSKRRKT